MALPKKTLAIAAVVCLIGIPVAIAQMQGTDIQKMMQMITPASSDPASTRDFKQAHMDMMKNMNIQFSGDPDIGSRVA